MLRFASCSSTNLDPYRAGVEIGEHLAGLDPEVVFLFTSIHYQGSPELLEGIYDVLESDQVVIFGNTGDGFYELRNVAGSGAAALAINTGGACTWHISVETGVSAKPYAVTRQCLENLQTQCSTGGPRLIFLASDHRTDSSEVNRAIREATSTPVVGGLAGDDYTFNKAFVYANRRVLEDSIAMLAVEGDIAFDIRLAHNLQPIGRSARVTDSEGTTVRTIDGIPAMEFLRRELGKPLDIVDEGIITFKVTEPESAEEYRIRSLLLPEDHSRDSSIKLIGGVEPGKLAQVCLAPPDCIIQDVREIVDSFDDLPFTPRAAVIVSCAGRKQVMAGRIQDEVTELTTRCTTLEALIGYPSFGEFGPIQTTQGYSRSMFHNMTFVLLLLGEPSA